MTSESNKSYNLPKSILVVDDDESVRAVTKKILENYGVDAIDLAEDGEEAWQKLQVEEVRMIMLDWNMPRLKGIDLVNRLRADAKFKELPIIMITSESAKYNVIEAINAGVNDYLVKPVSEASLEAKIKKYINL